MSEHEPKKKKYTRITGFFIIVLCIFLLLILKLAYLQIFKGEDYRTTAEAKGEKQILEIAPRGEILDKNGKKLATDLQSFNITYSSYSKKTKNSVINKELLYTISIISKNGDSDKLNVQNFPIEFNNQQYDFTYQAKTEGLRIKLANNYVLNKWKLDLPKLTLFADRKNDYRINNAINEKNLNKRARDAFYLLAYKYGLTEESKDDTVPLKSTVFTDETSPFNLYHLRKDLSMVVIQKLIALRLGIDDIRFSQYRSVYIANNVKRETALAMYAKADTLDGFNCEIAPMRYYPNGEVGSAFLGYLGKIDETEADKFKSLGYDISRELVGKMGLEKVLENNKDLNIKLRGEPGFKYVNVDKFGKILKQTATLDPIAGDAVKTTIDLNLQKVAENALDTTMKNISTGKTKSDALYSNANRGAAIVVDVNNGEVLALASRPGFDPNWFSATGSISTEISNLVFPTDMDDRYDKLPKRMFNYATMGTGPPGSTFKPFVAISALQEKDITPTMTIIDRGVYSVIKGFNGACWLWHQSHSTHGKVNLAKALEVSCNYYFFDVGRRLGYSNFENWAWKFGLSTNPKTGEKPYTGIEIDEKPGEASSPYLYKTTNINLFMIQEADYLKDYKHGGYTITKGTQDYKIIKDMFMNNNYDEKKLNSLGIDNKKALRNIRVSIKQFNNEANSVGQLLNASIGQGSTLLTPLQMVNYISTLVNGGNRYRLHLVKDVLNPDGTVNKVIQPQILNHIDLDPNNVDAVKEGMKKVTEEGGTASTAFKGLGIQTGGKTGSASVSDGQKRHGRSAYGWYVGFAPLDHPKIAVAVVIYDAGHGGSVAPVARAIYDQYFGYNKKTKVTTTQAINKKTVD